MVTPGSSFEQTMMGWSPQCYIQSFEEIGTTVPEKKIRRVFTNYGRGSHLGHLTSLMSSDFHLVQIGTVVSGKIQVEFLYVHNLGPRSRNDLNLQFSHIFIYSIRCQLLLHFRSLAAIVSEPEDQWSCKRSPVWPSKVQNIQNLENIW